MHTIAIIARFELAYQLRQPVFYLIAVLIFGQGIWYSAQLNTLYSYTDATLTTYLTLASLGVIAAVAAVLLAGQSLTKDLDYRTNPYLFSVPIASRMHFAGRFIGTYTTALLLAAFYPIGIGVYSLLNSSYEALPWLSLADGFVRLVAQNVFIVVSLTFSLTVFLRSLRGAYVSLFLVVLCFLLTESSLDLVADSDLWQLLDPFGVGMARESVESQAFSDDPHGWLVYSDLFFINRLLWLGLATGLLAYAENHFSFAQFTRTKPQSPTKADQPVRQAAHRLTIPSVQPRFGGWLLWQTTGRLTRLEFLNLVRQPFFLITAGLLTILAILLTTALGLNPDFPELPTTSRMTALRLSMGLGIGLFTLIMTGELIFQERTVGFWPIYDALPQPNFVLLSAKLLALVGATALLTIVLFLTGIGVQLSTGFTDINWTQYASDLLVDGFLRYCQLIALGALFASLVNNRLLSHLINLLIFAALTFEYQRHQEPLSFLYSFLPGSATYSDLIGYGANTSLRPVLHWLWWGVAGVFLTSFLLTWNRGVAMSFFKRVEQWRNQFRWPYRLAFLLFGLLIGLSFWQTQRRLTTLAFVPIPHYTTQTVGFQSSSGQSINVQIRYHHSYQVQHILQAAQSALQKGEQLFGPYPYDQLQIEETPMHGVQTPSKPGQILLSEKKGWIASNQQPNKLDYIDYLVSREVLKQWLVHRLKPKAQPGDGFIRQSLAEYLALQSVGQQYGSERLKEQLTQRAVWYAKVRQRSGKPEPILLRSSGNDAVERGRAALALTSIEQVWGAKPLSFTISQFYKKAIDQPDSATATAFAIELTHQLPDSLAYLKTYLSEPLWFDFKIGRVANLSNGLTVEIISTKWREAQPGQRQPLPINDYVPLAVLDRDGRIIYRRLVHPSPDNQYVALPVIPGGHNVIIDPLGAWPEPNKRDNAKLF